MSQSIIRMVVVLLVIGVALYFFAPFVDPMILKLIIGVLVVGVLIWGLQASGLWGGPTVP